MLQENHKIKEPETVHESLQRRADIQHTHVHMHVCVCVYVIYAHIHLHIDEFNRVHSKLTSELTNIDQKVHQISVSIDNLIDATLQLAMIGYYSFVCTRKYS